MGLKLISAKLTAMPGASGWCQVYEFTPWESQKLAKRGRLFAVISTSSQEKEKSIEVGREAISRLNEEYYGNLEKKALFQLKHVCEKMLEDFSFFRIEISAVSILNDNLAYLVVAGGSGISILRDGKLIQLLKGRKDKVYTASGYVKNKDLIILGTDSFFERFSKDTLKLILEKKDFESVVEELAPSLQFIENSGRLGALFLKFGESLGSENKTHEVLNKKVGPFLDFSHFFKKIWERRVYVRSETNFQPSLPARKTPLSVGIILFLLLIVSIFFGIKKERERQEKLRFLEDLSFAKHALEEAQSLFILNPSRSRELILEARQRVLGLEKEGIENEELLNLKGKLKENEKEILGEYRQDPQLFVNLSLLSYDFKGSQLSSGRSFLFVLDKEHKKVVRIDVDSKGSEVVAGPNQIDEVFLIVSYAEKVFLVNSKGVFRLDSGEMLIEPFWSGEVLSYAYAGNFYILDKESSKIYRFQGTENKFGTKQEWLSSRVNVDLSKAHTFIIDGSIWVLTEDSKILKFSLGNLKSFEISGVFPELEAISAIYTSDELNYLYILEKDKGRIVVVTKEGEYRAQYLSDKISQAFDLAVFEKEKKIILLLGDKLLFLNIEHL